MGAPVSGGAVEAVLLGGATAYFATADGDPRGSSPEAMAGKTARALAERVGVRLPVLYARQVHSRLAYVYAAHERLAPVPHFVGACDALITAEPMVALTVRTADCLPVAIAGGGVAAIVHAGWRGLAADILAVVVRRIEGEFGVPASALAAAVGVGIGPCHYPVGTEVIEALAVHAAGRASWHGDGYVNLAAWARSRLLTLGLEDAGVGVLPGCTACDARYHSYRRDGDRAGRQWSAVIVGEQPT